ncbi:MAG: 2,3-bisphosphoglycerate-independent phosphoglycerate mutase, partial [Actinomycetia bacterium]|nr:2,3-bisphosphoglycerate-independent phosphoglycerate mutase [Actinomycetes bacterium]
MTGTPKPLTLLILDGWGISPKTFNNVLAIAKTPHMDGYMASYPHTIIKASGEDVGLPKEQMGNSEVGHLNIGAGRIVYQDFNKINKAIEDNTFFKNEALLKAVKRTKEKGSFLHLMGLLSDGGVHSHINHLLSLMKMALDNGLKNIALHVFLDGRDVPPQSAISYLEELERELEILNIGSIATVSGRYYGMDRVKHW